tara:strand:+ start:2769 stop:2930 length:162 start_codon:yes stop_codon:yes gene_type:complete
MRQEPAERRREGKAEILRNSTGEKNRKTGKPVISVNESVRGIWDPFHGAKVQI